MTNNETDKEIYNTRVCEFCVHKDECTQNKFHVYVRGGTTTMRCTYYDYKNKEN